ncbi:MAG TPA: MFS transporter [Candidatus Desulfobacillus sp.]|nr:MFS transporter [Candidatus Desulfobacillus sp.]
MANVKRSGALGETVRPREVWAWAMYDFANSGYTTVVITAVFSAYFVAVVAARAPWATLAWTATLSLSYALIVATAPLVGAWADARAAKKRLLAISTVGCVLFTAGLGFSGPGALALAVACVVASNFFFGTGENLIAAFLPELADSRAMGRVSGWGWSLGYLGGLLSLGLCLAWLARAQAAGQAAAEAVPQTMFITAALFALASLPTFLFLRERAAPQPAAGAIARAAWSRVAATLRQARRFRDLSRFLLCTLFYQAGIAAVITLAAIYAQEAMHFTTQQTLVLILVVNLTAAVGAFFFGYVQDRIGHVRAIALTLCGWIVMVLLAWLAEGAALFWVAANLAGLCMGASQSAGRAMVGFLAPPSRLAEFFGLWGLAVKLASIFGPLTYGLANWLSGGDHRRAILITGIWFIAGLLLLGGVDVRSGRRAALRAARREARPPIAPPAPPERS